MGRSLMHLNSLLDHFDSYTRLHIGVNIIRDQLVDLGIQDEIRFHFVDIDAGALRGLLFRHTRHSTPYGEPLRCSDVCIATSLSPEWKRLVAVKELLHITDTAEETAQSEAAVDRLIENLSLPMDIQQETRSSLNDRTHIIPALAVLVPKECRKILRSLRQQERITATDVATIARIPDRYAEFVISDEFDNLVESIRGINGHS